MTASAVLRTAHLAVSAAMLIGTIGLCAAQATQPDTAASIRLICLAEQPAIVEGEAVILRTWTVGVPAEATEDLRVQWQVTDGRIEMHGAIARWDLSTVTLEPREGQRRVQATIAALPAHGSAIECRVEVAIGSKDTTLADRGTLRGETLSSAKRYLLPGDTEEEGYGLYSYLLFSAPPRDGEETARYLKTIEAYLLVLQDVDEYLRRHVRKRHLNATYIPLRQLPQPAASNDEWAASVLAVYDYTAAQELLRNVGASAQQGPYLISALQPLTRSAVSTHLWEDLSGVVPDLAWDWLRFFTYLAAQERSWSQESLRRLALNMHNLIAVAGKVAPELVSGFIRLEAVQ
jgi:hypothetical protein